MQQIGILFVAMHYYRKALELPCPVHNSETLFDLKREAAHNLALIYENSGNMDVAIELYEKYCVI